MTAIYIEDQKISYKELLDLIENKEIKDPIFPVTYTLDCVVSILTCLMKGIAFFPYSPHLTEKPKVNFPKDCDFILHTSGSSKMKYAMFSKDMLIASNMLTHEAFRLSQGDVYLLNLPLYHVAGLSLIMRAFLRGASIAIRPLRPSIVTHISLVPAMVDSFLCKNCYPNLKALLLGGNTIEKSLAEAIIDKGYRLYITYGMTEMCSHVFVSKYKTEEGVCFTSPLIGREIKFNKKGILYVKGCGKFQKYKNHKEKEWINTKDIFKNLNGRYYFEKRDDNMFISGGENIYPEEIKKALLSHGDIYSVNVKIKRHIKWGKRPQVFIYHKNKKMTKKSIQYYLQDRLEKFKIPKNHEIALCTESSFAT